MIQHSIARLSDTSHDRLSCSKTVSSPHSSSSKPLEMESEMYGTKKRKRASAREGSYGRVSNLNAQARPSGSGQQRPSPGATSGFVALKVQPWLVRALTSMAITQPTPIQSACIPKILEGRDCIGGSRTGSGKTVAFAIPIIQRWAEDPRGIYALVLTPTRSVFYGSAC